MPSRNLLILIVTLFFSASRLEASSGIPEDCGISDFPETIADAIILPGDSLPGEGEAELFDAIYPDTPENEESVGILPPENHRTDNYRFRWNQIVVPGVLITAGSVGVSCFKGLKESIRHHFADLRKDHYLKFDDYIQYLPVAAYLGLGFTRLPSRGDHIDRVMAGVTAYAMMAIVVNVTKYCVREMRPDGSRRNSFPSGHSATVFTGAELMRLEYGNYIGIAGYAVACTVGFMRMYNDRHWLNDVLAGAGIGILAARAAYWLLPWERKLFRRDRGPRPEAEARLAGLTANKPCHNKSCFVAAPYYDAEVRGAGFSFAAVF